MKFPFVLRSTYEALLETCEDICLSNTELRKVNADLRKQLKEASKNDKRDPKTGRYVKGE